MDHHSPTTELSFVCIPQTGGRRRRRRPAAAGSVHEGSSSGETDAGQNPARRDAVHAALRKRRSAGRTAEQGLLCRWPARGTNGVKYRVEILVAGQKLTQTVPTSSGAVTFAWDGKDAYGRSLNGPTWGLRVGYTYEIVASDDNGSSSQTPFLGIPSASTAGGHKSLYQRTRLRSRARPARLRLGGGA
jgi:hypothetical protein